MLRGTTERAKAAPSLRTQCEKVKGTKRGHIRSGRQLAGLSYLRNSVINIIIKSSREETLS